MDEIITSNDENTSNDELEDLENLEEPWKQWPYNKSSPIPWTDVGPLSEDLQKLDEELKQQNDEARAWLEEECAADEILRSEINELQIARQKTQNLITLELQLPPEIREKINGLELQVRTLQDQIQEKADKLTQSYEVYSEVLAKLNETNERVIANDEKFKLSLLKVKEEYAEVEGVLRNHLETYKSLNQELQLQLNEKEAELADISDSRQKVSELQETVESLQKKLEETTQSYDKVNKYNIKLKAQLKKLSVSEKDAINKEKESSETIENLRKTVAQLEEERAKLLEERSSGEDVETLRNKIALLEEEKGNLQLQLIDLDEVKEAADATRFKYNSLEKESEILQQQFDNLKLENNNLSQDYASVKVKLEEQEDVIIKLKDALQNITEEKISAVMKSVEIEELLSMREREVAQLKEQLVALQDTSRKVETDNKTESEVQLSKQYDLEDRADELKTELLNKSEAVAHLQAQVSQLQDEISLFKEQNEKLLLGSEEIKTENSHLKNKLEEAVAKEEKLKHDLMISSQSSNLPQEKDVAAQKYKQLAANFKKKKQLCQELENEVKQLKTELSNRDIEKEQLLSLKTELENQLEGSQQTITIQEDELMKYKHESTRLLASIQQLQNLDEQQLDIFSSETAQTDRISSMIQNVEKLQPQLNQLHMIIKEKEEIIAELELERSNLVDVVKANDSELEMLRSLYEKESMKNENYYSDLMNLENEMVQSKTELLTRLQEVTENYDKALASLREKDSYINATEEEITKLKSKVIEIDNCMESKEKVFKEKYTELLSKLENAEALAQKSMVGFNQLVENKLETFQKNEQFFKNKIINLEVDYEDLKETLDATNLRNSNLEKEIKGANETIEEMANELEMLRETKEAYINTLDKIEELNGELKETVKSFESRNEKIISLESERGELISKLNDLEEAFTDLENKLIAAESNVQKLHSELKRRDSALNESNQQLAQLQLQLSQSVPNQSILEQYQKSLKENSVQIQQLEEILSEKLKEIQGKDVHLNILEAENRALKANNNDNFLKLKQLEASLEDKIEEINRLTATLNEKKGDDMEQWGNLMKQAVVQDIDSVVNEAQVQASQIRNDDAPPEEPMGVFTWSDQAQGESSDNPFGELKDEEDGWGWMGGSEQLDVDRTEVGKVQELQLKIHRLEEEKGRISVDLETTRVKCQKLLKKIKEMKIQIDNLERSKATSNVGLSDLDFALQEELSKENDRLQTKINELNAQMTTVKNERTSLLNRIDTLTAANDKLIDVKERQDIEVQMWQRRCTELSNQVQGVQGSSFGQQPYLEIAGKLAATTKENDELKLKLALQKEQLEKVSAERYEIEKSETDSENFKIDTELENKYQAVLKENYQLKIQLDAKTKEIGALLQEKFGIENQLKSFQNSLVQYNSISQENNELKTSLQSKIHEFETLEFKLSSIQQENKELKSLLDTKTKELDALQAEKIDIENKLSSIPYDDICRENNELKLLLNTKEKEIERLQAEKIELENKLLSVPQGNVSQENNELKLMLSSKAKEFEVLRSEKIEIENKLKLLELEKSNFAMILEENTELKSSLEAKRKEIESIQQAFNKSVEQPMIASHNFVQQSSPHIFQGFSSPSDDIFSNLAQNQQRTEIDQVQQQIDENLKEIAVLKERNSSLAQELHQLKAEKQQIEDKLLKVNKENENLTEKIKDGEKTVEFWKERSEQLTMEITSKESSYHDRLKEIEDYYQQSLLTKDEENSHLVCTISAKDITLKELSNEVEKLKSELEQIVELEEKIKSLNEENEKLKAEIENVKGSGDKTDSLANELSQEIRNLEEVIAKLNEEVQVKELEIQRLTQVCNDYLVHIQERDLEMSARNNDIANLQNYISSIQNTQPDSRAMEEIERLSKLVSDTQIQLQIQTEQLEAKTRLLTEAHNNLFTLQESTDLKNARDYQELGETLTALQKEKSRLEALVQEKLSAAEEMERELAMYKSQGNLATEEKNVNSYKQLIEQKDLEIERLSTILNETREKLVRKVQMEENRAPYLRSLEVKLDQALYVVHLRDMKCEELTQEIMQLIEERDTLQIRLSESMRAYDALKNKFGTKTKDEDTVQPSAPINTKITELHTGYNKDPVVQMERESRHTQQMQLYNTQDTSENDESSVMDYGIFNWFFGGSPSPQGNTNEVSS